MLKIHSFPIYRQTTIWESFKNKICLNVPLRIKGQLEKEHKDYERCRRHQRIKVINILLE